MPLILEEDFMKKILSNLLLVSTLNTSTAHLLEVPPSAIVASKDIEKSVGLYYHCKKNQFLVKQGMSTTELGSESLDNTLRNTNSEKLAALLKLGYIAINKTNDGKFILRANVKGFGGGPLAGQICYWGVKATAFGVGATCMATGAWKWINYVMTKTGSGELAMGSIVLGQPLFLVAYQEVAEPALEIAASAAQAVGDACSFLP